MAVLPPAYDQDWPLSQFSYSIMPEVPGHIQDGIANMELESKHSRVSSMSSQPSYGYPSPGLSSGPQTPVPGQYNGNTSVRQLASHYGFSGQKNGT